MKMRRAVLVAMAVASCAATAWADALSHTIIEAGNADTDEERLAILRAFLPSQELPAEYRADLERLIAEIDRWVSEKDLSYYDKPVRDRGTYDFGLSRGSYFEPLTWIYQGRMRAWVALEYSGIWSDPAARRKMMDETRSYFERAHKLFGNNDVLRMYLGKPIPPAKTFAAPEAAPDWAVAQREGLERLADIVEWWIDHRMQENGEYGGGWGDDCEMWRWWVPVLIAFDDPKITAAQARFSSALLAQPHMAAGYTNHVYDVEHTAEDSADTITPMMHLEPDAPVWRDRALRLAELMERQWTGVNERGQLQFRSVYFSSDKVDETPARACDAIYHSRAVQPSLLYWQRTGDARLGGLFTKWIDTWVAATASAERGKPAGVVPAAIHWPDGEPAGTGRNWWDPECHTNDPIYIWPSAMGEKLPNFLLAYHMTGDEKYLQPLRSMAAIRLNYVQAPEKDPAPGSEAWCGMKMASLAPVLAKYRLLTGSKEFDALLERETAPYVAYRLKGEEKGLVQALRETAKALSTNFAGYTSEVRYTDRVLRFPSLFEENGMFPEAVGGFASPDPALLYSSATGDPGSAGYFPMNAVRWLTPPRDIAALVTDSGRTRFEARLYHFGSAPRPMEAELYLLNPGRYELSLWNGETNLGRQAVTADGPRTRVAFELPERTECHLRVE